MSIRISKGRSGTTIRARGKDAQALVDLMCRSLGEPTRPAIDHAAANEEANDFTQQAAHPHPTHQEKP